MFRLELIPKLEVVKRSKCQSCVQAKQPRKPFKGLEEKRDLAPLNLIHSDLCEMNGLLTRGGKRYFVTLIDDAIRSCYVYLLKTKDEHFATLKILRLRLRTKLRERSSVYVMIVEENTSPMSSLNSVLNMV